MNDLWVGRVQEAHTLSDVLQYREHEVSVEGNRLVL